MAQAGARLIETAQQVKASLKQLIEIVCAEEDEIQLVSTSKTMSMDGDLGLGSGLTAITKADLGTPLEEQLAEDLTQARRVYVDTSKFIPVNFLAVSAKTPDQAMVNLKKHQQLDRVCKVRRVVGEEALSRCQNATDTLQSIIRTPPRRGRPVGSKGKVKSSSHAEAKGKVSNMQPIKPPAHALSSPPAAEMDVMESQLLAWIPNKHSVLSLSADGVFERC